MPNAALAILNKWQDTSGADFRFLDGRKQWVRWTGAYWKPCLTLDVLSDIEKVTSSLNDEAIAAYDMFMRDVAAKKKKAAN